MNHFKTAIVFLLLFSPQCKAQQLDYDYKPISLNAFYFEYDETLEEIEYLHKSRLKETVEDRRVLRHVNDAIENRRNSFEKMAEDHLSPFFCAK